MFKEFMGLPLHPLAVHAAVVLIPLLALGAAGYAMLPRFRPQLGWVVWVLAVVTPLMAIVARESGESLQEVVTEKHYPSSVLHKVAQHADYADTLQLLSLGLGITTILLLLQVRSKRGARMPRWAPAALVVVVVGLSGLNLVYSYLAGDSGAKLVWTGVL
ncbi:MULTISPECIES: DUF2231 domain-containing protein [Streptomyces]|uniref:DUF2231 domain-containing protein n=2 Tax=Streptomyces TaxID=1883 RepID=A0ABV7SB10_9ACTN|nr:MULTISPECIES: DUF2231 domain-containing protein [unclassified Streptomyces]MDX2683077.1 hypothetical protein [Streptomyces sp. NY05-11A]WNB99146.1 DUF2231 domain-containing protein [Streptomyces sp. CGMCC 4.7035]